MNVVGLVRVSRAALPHLRESQHAAVVNTCSVAGVIDNAEDPAVALAALQRRQPMGRLVTAEEVAHAIAYLASPFSASTTGTLLAVDGGMSNVRI